MIKIDILTLFPSMFDGPFDTSMLKKAQDNNFLEVNIHDLRNWSGDKHKTVDDRPYGGGKGMVIRVDVVDHAISSLKKSSKAKNTRTILLCPQGKVFSQTIAKRLSALDHLILVAGHYEGFDERIRHYLVDEEISIGNYILTGGEIPAMVLTDSISRLIPGVLSEEATQNESFSDGENLDFPVYTRPPEYKGWGVPGILLTGDHKKINDWRSEEANKKTKLRKQ